MDSQNDAMMGNRIRFSWSRMNCFDRPENSQIMTGPEYVILAIGVVRAEGDLKGVRAFHCE